MKGLRMALAGVASLVFAIALALAVIERPSSGVDLPALLSAAIDDAGAAHPITAVLLDFRSFDTLLEVGVLLLAVVVAYALREVQPDGPDRMGLETPLLRAVISLLLPLMLLVGAYVLWAGATRPGGAFQAGAIFAASGVALRLAGLRLAGLDQAWRVHALLALGLAVFVLAAVAPAFAGRAMLDHDSGLAGLVIIGVEIALTVSIALGLLALFRLAPPQADGPSFGDRRRKPREDG
jgi:multisubunit Na+/H+ antiporter MnhB subunit